MGANDQVMGFGRDADQIGVIAIVITVAGFDLAAFNLDRPIGDGLQRVVQRAQTHFLQCIINGLIIKIMGLVGDFQMHQRVNL